MNIPEDPEQIDKLYHTYTEFVDSYQDIEDLLPTLLDTADKLSEHAPNIPNKELRESAREFIKQMLKCGFEAKMLGDEAFD